MDEERYLPERDPPFDRPKVACRDPTVERGAGSHDWGPGSRGRAGHQHAKQAVRQLEGVGKEAVEVVGSKRQSNRRLEGRDGFGDGRAFESRSENKRTRRFGLADRAILAGGTGAPVQEELERASPRSLLLEALPRLVSQLPARRRNALKLVDR